MSENTTVTASEAVNAKLAETIETGETKAPKAKDFTVYATKAPTSLHVHYAGWIQEKTGLELAVENDVMSKIVQLAVTLYHDYQASDENKARKAAEQANKPAKTPSKTAAELAAMAAEIEQLKAQLAAAQKTPATRKATAKATQTADAK